MQAGDPYPDQVGSTAAAVVAALDRPGLDWQVWHLPAFGGTREDPVGPQGRSPGGPRRPEKDPQRLLAAPPAAGAAADSVRSPEPDPPSPQRL